MKKILSLLTTITPALVLADQTTDSVGRTIDGFLNWLVGLAGRVMPLLILLALVLFLYGIVKRFFWSKDSSDRTEAGKFILWGVVALFVMVSVWGLVNLLRNTFNLDNSNVPVPPSIPVQDSPRAIPVGR